MPLPLLDFQHVGADFLSGRTRGALFDEMGVGKTAQAIAALDRAGLVRGIVVCPAAVRQVWYSEFKKFAARPRRIVKSRSVADLAMWLRGSCDVLLLSYEMAAKWGPKIEDRGDVFDFVIFDEAHYLKSPDANRTKAMLGGHCEAKTGLARWASHVWFLTGTPMPNDPLDIWPLLRFMGGTDLTQAQFSRRYFRSRLGTFSSRQEPLDAMVPELRQAIRCCSIRRTTKEAGLDLPPIWLTTVSVDGDTDDIRALLRDWPGLEDAIIEAVELGGLSFLEAQHIATLRRLVGEAKAPAYAAMLVEEFANGRGKTVIGGLHVAAIEHVRAHLSEHGIGTVMITGATPEKQREEAVRAFQEDKGVLAFIGNLRAAGTGLTLHAAADVDMFESDWAPATNAQFLKRVHRIGQERVVRARFVSLANSIDDIVSETVTRKTAAIAKIEAP